MRGRVIQLEKRFCRVAPPEKKIYLVPVSVDPETGEPREGEGEYITLGGKPKERRQ